MASIIEMGRLFPWVPLGGLSAFAGRMQRSIVALLAVAKSFIEPLALSGDADTSMLPYRRAMQTLTSMNHQ